MHCREITDKYYQYQKSQIPLVVTHFAAICASFKLKRYHKKTCINSLEVGWHDSLTNTTKTIQHSIPYDKNRQVSQIESTRQYRFMRVNLEHFSCDLQFLHSDNNFLANKKLVLQIHKHTYVHN